MKSKHFYSLFEESVRPLLSPLGFSCDRSESAVFYREAEMGVFHVIMPDSVRSGEWYDIKVFPVASVFDPMFGESFPDNIGIPTDIFCYLSVRGVGPEQELFRCKTADIFKQEFDAKVSRLITQFAIPFLDQFCDIASMIPHIHNELYKAIAVYYADGPLAAREPLLRQRKRMDGLDTAEKKVVQMREYLDELIGKDERK